MDKGMNNQRDTLEINNSLKDLFRIQEKAELRINHITPAPIEPIPLRDTIREVDSVKQMQPLQPTMAQIRYWRWQREQKLLIGDSRYIKPRNEVNFVKSVSFENTGFGLPSKIINSPGTDWLTVIFMLLLVLFASLKNSYSRYLGNLFKSVINYSTSFRMFREKNYSFLHGAHRLEIFFYVIFSVFLFQTIRFLPVEVNKSNLKLFFFCFSITLAYYFIKKLAYKLTGFITETSNETNEYLFNMDSINRVGGLILFPLVIIGVFFPYSSFGLSVYLGLFVLLIMYLKLLQRGILILFKKQFSIFYLFLYFCTLEFVPLVLLYDILEL
jgi:hypothetical protein